MWRRICSATYSCARSCWIGSNGAPAESPFPTFRRRDRETSIAMHGLPSDARDALEVRVEQPPRRRASLAGPLERLREQPVGVDPLAVELVPIDANPRRHDLRRNLGVELGAEAAADHERLRPDAAVG